MSDSRPLFGTSLHSETKTGPLRLLGEKTREERSRRFGSDILEGAFAQALRAGVPYERVPPPSIVRDRLPRCKM